jgi:hypothetical protein
MPILGNQSGQNPTQLTERIPEKMCAQLSAAAAEQATTIGYFPTALDSRRHRRDEPNGAAAYIQRQLRLPFDIASIAAV